MATLTNKATVAYKLSNVDFTNDSNTSTFEILTPSLLVVKSNLPIAGIVGTVVVFTIVITNQNLLFPATNVILTDNLAASGYTYVTGTAKVNGIVTAGIPTTGITVGTLAALGVSTVTFNATVN